MNRLAYWITAQTEYHLHSPMVFNLYGSVLFAPLDSDTRRALQLPRRHRQFYALAYKLADHFEVTAAATNRGEDAVLRRCLALARPDAPLLVQPTGGEELLEFVSMRDGRQHEVCLVCAPHADRAAEQRWEQWLSRERYRVSIDLFDAAVLLSDPHLSRQHFLLR